MRVKWNALSVDELKFYWLSAAAANCHLKSKIYLVTSMDDAAFEFNRIQPRPRAELLREGEGHHHTRIVSRRLAVKNRAAAALWRTVPSPSG